LGSFFYFRNLRDVMARGSPALPGAPSGTIEEYSRESEWKLMQQAQPNPSLHERTSGERPAAELGR
jgi:hypothetical protein